MDRLKLAETARKKAGVGYSGAKDIMDATVRVIAQNAASYSAPGTRVTLGISADAKSVSYSVRDEGIGMSAEDASHVFERFWRSDSARDASQEGTGLELSIASWIVEEHGGSIDIVSREGVGSRFTVLLPRT